MLAVLMCVVEYPCILVEKDLIAVTKRDGLDYPLILGWRNLIDI